MNFSAQLATRVSGNLNSLAPAILMPTTAVSRGERTLAHSARTLEAGQGHQITMYCFLFQSDWLTERLSNIMNAGVP